MQEIIASSAVSQIQNAPSGANVEMARRAVSGMRSQAVKRHKSWNAVSVETVSWAAHHQLVTNEFEISRAKSIRVGELAAFTFSREPLPVVQMGADLILWLFLFDDAIGEPPAEQSDREHQRTLQRYATVVRERRLISSHPFEMALLDLLFRAEQLGATADWFERFGQDMTDYFNGCVEENKHRRAHQPLSSGNYRELRRATVGTSQVFALIELGVGGIVPPHEIRKRDVIEARKIAALLTAWVNDIYSFPKELAANDPLNLVIALAVEHNFTSTMEALELAAIMYNMELEHLESQIDCIIKNGCSSQLTGYLDGLLRWVHGNRLWTKLCGRYV